MILFTLGTNNMSGTLPSELGMMTAATLLNTQGNHFTGTIPSQLGLITDMTLALALHHNSLNGSIPSELGQLTLLQELRLDGNELSGQIPSELGQMTMMGRLSLHDNALEGGISPQLAMLEPSLYSLSLHGNPSLTGTFPEALCTVSGTCFMGLASLKPCSTHAYGVSYDCSPQLCGCECLACEAPASAMNHGH